MFEPDGGLRTYVYHQDMKGKQGDSKKALNFHFIPGKYYQVYILVSLNTLVHLADGKMLPFVDGSVVIRYENIRFRQKISDESLISKVLFSTFHGGVTPEQAPRTIGKGYNTECGYFNEENTLMKKQPLTKF